MDTRAHADGDQRRALPLDGVRILDLSRLLPGPYASLILADLGAEVIKVEEPHLADFSRSSPPYYNELSVYFCTVNRNKKSITLNLKEPEAREMFFELAKDADVVFETFRPGVTERLGIDYEKVRAVNPDIIYCSLSGYGQTGPYRSYGGHDLNISGLAGTLSYVNQGKADDPIMPGVPIADFSGSLWAVIAIVSALKGRDRMGGQYLDVSIWDGVASLLIRDALYHFAGATELLESSVFYAKSPRYNIYETAEGRHITLGALEPKFWRRFCERFDRMDLVDPDETYEDRMTSTKRYKWDEAFDFLRTLFKSQTMEYWLKELQDLDVPCYAVLTVDEVLESEHAADRRMFPWADHPTEGRIRQVATPIKMSGAPLDELRPAPHLGAHNREIYGSIGYTEAQLDDLRSRDVI